MRHDDVFAAELARLRAAGLERRLRPVDGAQDTSIIVDGHRVLSLCSNNYLGLATQLAGSRNNPDNARRRETS